MKALQVSIDGRVIGSFSSPDPGPFLAMMRHLPRKYMRAHIMTETSTESWQWQLPDIQYGECIEFRMTEVEREAVRPPQFVRQRETEEITDDEK